MAFYTNGTWKVFCLHQLQTRKTSTLTSTQWNLCLLMTSLMISWLNSWMKQRKHWHQKMLQPQQQMPEKLLQHCKVSQHSGQQCEHNAETDASALSKQQHHHQLQLQFLQINSRWNELWWDGDILKQTAEETFCDKRTVFCDYKLDLVRFWHQQWIYFAQGSTHSF